MSRRRWSPPSNGWSPRPDRQERTRTATDCCSRKSSRPAATRDLPRPRTCLPATRLSNHSVRTLPHSTRWRSACFPVPRPPSAQSRRAVRRQGSMWLHWSRRVSSPRSCFRCRVPRTCDHWTGPVLALWAIGRPTPRPPPQRRPNPPFRCDCSSCRSNRPCRSGRRPRSLPPSPVRSGS